MHERLTDQPSLVKNKLYDVLILEKLVGESGRVALLSANQPNGVGFVLLDVARQPTDAQAVQDEHECHLSSVGLRVLPASDTSGAELRQTQK